MMVKKKVLAIFVSFISCFVMCSSLVFAGDKALKSAGIMVNNIEEVIANIKDELNEMFNGKDSNELLSIAAIIRGVDLGKELKSLSDYIEKIKGNYNNIRTNAEAFINEHSSEVSELTGLKKVFDDTDADTNFCSDLDEKMKFLSDEFSAISSVELMDDVIKNKFIDISARLGNAQLQIIEALDELDIHYKSEDFEKARITFKGEHKNFIDLMRKIRGTFRDEHLKAFDYNTKIRLTIMYINKLCKIVNCKFESLQAQTTSPIEKLTDALNAIDTLIEIKYVVANISYVVEAESINKCLSDAAILKDLFYDDIKTLETSKDLEINDEIKILNSNVRLQKRIGKCQTELSKLREGLIQHLKLGDAYNVENANSYFMQKEEYLHNNNDAIGITNKLCAYALNLYHPKGKDKAINIVEALGYTIKDCGILEARIRQGIANTFCCRPLANRFLKKFFNNCKCQPCKSRVASKLPRYFVKEISDKMCDDHKVHALKFAHYVDEDTGKYYSYNVFFRLKGINFKEYDFITGWKIDEENSHYAICLTVYQDTIKER